MNATFHVKLFWAIGLIMTQAAVGQVATWEQRGHKDLTFEWVPKNPNALGGGTARFGENTAGPTLRPDLWDKKGPVTDNFQLDTTQASYGSTIKATATYGVVKAETTNFVGTATVKNDGKTYQVPASQDFFTKGPQAGLWRSNARGSIQIQGVVPVANRTDNVFLVSAKGVPKQVANNSINGLLFNDPIHLNMVGENSGEVWDADIFGYGMESSVGASVGLNLDDRLELRVDDLAADAVATFWSDTMVDWATDYDGFAQLTNGLFIHTGIFAPSSYWDVETLPNDNDYVVRAVLKPEFLPDFDVSITPPVEALDDYAFTLSSESFLEVTSVPEPGTLALLGLGGFGVAYRRRCRVIG